MAEVSEGVGIISACSGQGSLVHLLPVYLLLNGPTCDETIDDNIPGLADAACSVHTLVVHTGVPGRIQDDDPVRRCQRQAQASNLGGQQEDGNRWVRLKLLNPFLQAASTM